MAMTVTGVASLLGGIGVLVLAINIFLAVFIGWHLAIEVMRSRRLPDAREARSKGRES